MCLREPAAVRRVIGQRRSDQRCHGLAAPCVRRLYGHLADVVEGHARIIVRSREARGALEQDQRLDSFGFGRRDQQRNRCRFDRGEQGAAFRPNRVEHGANILGPVFPDRNTRPRHTVGCSLAALIEHDDSAERCQPTQEVCIRRPFPPHVNGFRRPRDVHHITRSFTQHLIGDPILTDVSELGLGNFHPDSIPIPRRRSIRATAARLSPGSARPALSNVTSVTRTQS